MYNLFEHIAMCVRFWKTARWTDVVYSGETEAKWYECL